MGADIAFHDIGGEGRSVEEFMAPKRPWFVLLSPVRAMVSGEFVEQLLAFLFRVGYLECVLAHIYFSSPACRKILLSVPMGTSSDSLPGTVTLPALVACLHCRWLPFCDTCSHLPLVSKRTTSRTFM